MKILAATLILLSTITTQAFANGRDYDGSALPGEYKGYVEYKKLDKYGRLVQVKEPVIYRRVAGAEHNFSDVNNEIRDCRIELERARVAREEDEDKQKIYSAKYYPIYFDQ